LFCFGLDGDVSVATPFRIHDMVRSTS